MNILQITFKKGKCDSDFLFYRIIPLPPMQYQINSKRRFSIRNIIPRCCYEICGFSFSSLFLISMHTIDEFINSVIGNYHIDSCMIQNMQGRLNEKWKVDGWISLILSNRECVVLRFDNGVFMNEGFVVNDQKVLKVIGNHQIGDISYNEEQSTRVVEGIVDLDHGSRFEGLVLTKNEGKMGIPFGYGEMYDDDGLLMYKGIMIDWKRFGYGTSYHDNRCVEYEGYWCDDNRFGIGKVYDRSGHLIKQSSWYNGIESNIYEGNGRKPLDIGMKHLKLLDNCVLDDWDVLWFLNLESIKIGNNCFESVQTFRIDRLNKLKTIKIGINSFTQVKKSAWDNNLFTAQNKADNPSKSFHILNCESLESIQIGEYSFSDFAGEFELKNLPQLQSIRIGTIGSKSYNFFDSLFVIRGIELILNIVMIRSSKSTIHYIRWLCIL